MRGLEMLAELRSLEPMFEEWLSLLTQAAEGFRQTEGFWYNERTLAGLLSAAAWRSGLPSIIEAKTTRTLKSGSKRQRSGHFDVLVRLEGGTAAFETKVMWFSDPDGPNRLLGELASARLEASGLPESHLWRIALAFGVLENRGSNLVALLKDSLRIVRKKKPAIVAWFLDDAAGEDARYPGCILVGASCGSAKAGRKQVAP